MPPDSAGAMIVTDGTLLGLDKTTSKTGMSLIHETQQSHGKFINQKQGAIGRKRSKNTGKPSLEVSVGSSSNQQQQQQQQQQRTA